MSERKEKSLEQVSDEDYKIAPTSADEEIVERKAAGAGKKELVRGETKPSEASVQEELKEGVE
jgi:hypothetical protein